MQGGEAMAALAPLVAEARDAVAGAGRDDLVADLDRILPLVASPQPRVVVCGDFKQGKSELVNALCGAIVCVVDDDDSAATMTEVPSDGIVPARLVDLPGPDGLTQPVAVAAALGDVAGMILVSDASSELTRPEVAAVEAITDAGFPVVVAVPKIDFYSAWRKVCGLDEEHLQRRHIDVPVIPVSSVLEQLGRRADDRELMLEAGFSPLREWLATVAGRASAAAAIDVADRIRVAVAGVREAARATAAGTDLPGDERRQLQDRAQRVSALAGPGARWRRVLLDGIVDLEADGEHALETRLRAISREAEAALRETDPAGGWGRFSFWVGQRVSSDMAAAFGDLSSRAEHLSLEVAAAFEDDEATAVVLGPLRPPPIEGVAVPADSGAPAAPPRRRLASSLGRVDSTGVLDALSVLSLNPLSVAVGLLAGRRAVRSARVQEVEARRADALEAVRRYLDDATFVVRREWKAAVRSVERNLRDGYEGQAASLARSAAEAVEAAAAADDDPAAQAAAEQLLARLDAIDSAVVAAVAAPDA